ncbi:MAG: hypothetical protein SFU27_00780, partial [Thermonemataceae bacterium]|nr:hypothetical protein [Thermonemataceae bacterium]
MKKLILTAVLYIALLANSYAQTHSDLWYKIDSLKRALYVAHTNNPIHVINKYGLITNHPFIGIDDKIAWKNMERNVILDNYNLSQIAGIIYYLPGDSLGRYLYPGSGGIEIYTHTYANANP